MKYSVIKIIGIFLSMKFIIKADAIIINDINYYFCIPEAIYRNAILN